MLVYSSYNIMYCPSTYTTYCFAIGEVIINHKADPRTPILLFHYFYCCTTHVLRRFTSYNASESVFRTRYSYLILGKCYQGLVWNSIRTQTRRTRGGGLRTTKTTRLDPQKTKKGKGQNDVRVHTYKYFCWTYSHHCQMEDKNPSKRWNGEFRGFRICIGWISTTRFFVVGFYVLD